MSGHPVQYFNKIMRRVRKSPIDELFELGRIIRPYHLLPETAPDDFVLGVVSPCSRRYRDVQTGNRLAEIGEIRFKVEITKIVIYRRQSEAFSQ